MRVSVAQAAWLIGRSEKTVRLKIGSGELPATPTGPRSEQGKTGPSFYLIETDDLAKLPGVTLNPERLAEIAKKQGESPPHDSLVARLEAVESVFEELESEVTRLRQRIQLLEDLCVSAGLLPPESRLNPLSGAHRKAR